MKSLKTPIPMGEAICASLYQILIQIRCPEFRDAISSDIADMITDNIEESIVEIASLCCGSDSWKAMCDYLISAGVQLPEYFINAPER